jgi:NADPH-dependent 2,4-dienoyl-CoA reductase/sulfur reductase-like enzyme
MSKIVIIGSNHAGIAATNTILGQYKQHEVTVIERSSYMSYLGCGTALWIGGQLDDPSQLFYSSKEKLVEAGAIVHMETEVEQIDFDKKQVIAVSKDGTKFEQSYDKLILATGSRPILPNIEGIDLENVHYVKTFHDGGEIHEALKNEEIKSVAVIGAGYIGVELAEAIQLRGKKTYMFEANSSILPGYYDEWLTDEMQQHMEKNGIAIHVEEKIKAITGNSKATGIVTSKGSYDVDMVIVSVGFVANSQLGAGRLETTPNGAYKVNLKQETSVRDVYAVGDCAIVYSNALQDTAYIALATNAVRSGIVGAHNVCGTPLESAGVQGSNGISIYGYNMVSTGLTFKGAKAAGFDAIHTDFEDLQKPAFIKEGNHSVKIRIVYDKTTRRVLGAQLASFEDISMGIHMFSLAIAKQVTIDELKLLDIFFLPHFNQPYNYITMAALSAE